MVSSRVRARFDLRIESLYSICTLGFFLIDPAAVDFFCFVNVGRLWTVLEVV